MADGTTKRIDQIKVGDKVEDSVPGQNRTKRHTVQRVIVTQTDHDFVDVTVAPVIGGKPKLAGTRSRLRGIAAGFLATIALASATVAPAPAGAAPTVSGGGTLTTTYHPPFYGETQSAFVEAQHLHVGDILQTPTGTAEILAMRLFHATPTTYDLTINGLHTYYVIAGSVPLLVHNNNCPSISKKDIQQLYGRANTLYRSYGKDRATVAVARVWNRQSAEYEEWVATHLPDLPAEIKNNLGGARYIFGDGDAEATIVRELGDKYDLLGIASSTRICPTCYHAIKSVAGMVETTVGKGNEALPDFTGVAYCSQHQFLGRNLRC